MSKKQFILIVLAVILVGFAITAAINYFHNKTIQLNSEAVIKNLNSLASDAQEYYNKTRSQVSGQADFRGYKIPRELRSNENGTYTIVFSAVDQVTIQGTGVERQAQSPGCSFLENNVTYRILVYADSTRLIQIY